jgi:hypothetical protein
MKPLDYIILFVIGTLGQIFHLVTKAQSVKESAKVGNALFDYVTFLKDEAMAIISTLTMLVICICLVDSFLVYQPSAQPYLKVIFVFLGYTGSSLLISAMGKAQTRVNAIIDEKTNIADKC